MLTDNLFVNRLMAMAHDSTHPTVPQIASFFDADTGTYTHVANIKAATK